ncbi:hypothetical protein ACFOWA_14545 [Pedobacter lithocola]|uniref:Lysozyme family protein n=1 Tax=Pedobacter lithocola TaxID=1908239 RepID=A0ABV8PAW9_9SPHI
MKKKKSVAKIIKPSQPTDLEYIKLFNDCVIDKDYLGAIDKTIDDQINPNKSKYTDISDLVAGRNPSTTANSFYGFAPGFALNTRPLTTNFSNDPFSFPINKSPFQFKNPFETSINDFIVAGNQIPWYFIACAHYLECSFSFKKHLHNGDPLTNYTVKVPANRPKVGHPPPFTFEESAVDALKLMKFNEISNWNLPTVLRKLEAYNGFGYFKYHQINSPYLWSYSNQYSKGKYVSDGKFDSKAVSKQMGAAVILKRMEERTLISIPRH